MEEKLSFRCANCGETVEFQTLSNWRDAKRKDLDGRPRETNEFSLENIVHKCPKCGYVSFDISKNIIKYKSILTNVDYNEILNNKALPEVVNNFLALGFLYEKQEEFYHSAHSYLCAAWLLEKNLKKIETKAVLEKTAYCLLKYINSKSFKSNVDETVLTCTVDVLRKIGKFENAKKLAHFSFARVSDSEERNILIFEIALCNLENNESKEIPIFPFEKNANLKDVFEAIRNIGNEDDLQKQFVLSLTAEYIKNCKLDEIFSGIFLVVNKSKQEEVQDSTLNSIAEIIKKNLGQKDKVPERKPSRIINQSNFSERFGIKKEASEEETSKNIEDNVNDVDNVNEVDKVEDVENNTKIVSNIDIVYLDDKFNKTEVKAELLNTKKAVEVIKEVKEIEIEKTEEVEEVETTETSEETEVVEAIEVIEIDTTEELETVVVQEMEEPAEPEPTEAIQQVKESIEEFPQEEDTIEAAENIILMLAKFDGKISIGEVQALFECSYTKAKDHLDKIVKTGKLSWTTDEEVYNYSEI